MRGEVERCVADLDLVFFAKKELHLRMHHAGCTACEMIGNHDLDFMVGFARRDPRIMWCVEGRLEFRREGEEVI